MSQWKKIQHQVGKKSGFRLQNESPGDPQGRRLGSLSNEISKYEEKFLQEAPLGKSLSALGKLERSLAGQEDERMRQR
jgi:hypothetical protein